MGLKPAPVVVRPLDRAWQRHVDVKSYDLAMALLRKRGEGHWYIADAMVSAMMLRLRAEPRPPDWTPEHLQLVTED